MTFERPDDPIDAAEELDALYERIEYLHSVLTDSGEAQAFRDQIRTAEARINELRR